MAQAASGEYAWQGTGCRQCPHLPHRPRGAHVWRLRGTALLLPSAPAAGIRITISVGAAGYREVVPEPKPVQPELIVADAAAWRHWLSENYEDQVGVWLLLAKKGTTEPTSVTYAQALQEALCFGWIDGQGRGNDAATVFQRFTPRRTRSMWSQRNVGYVAVLTEAGRMAPSGLAEVERAKADGRWDAAYRQADFEVPADLVAAIVVVPQAAEMFEVLTKQNRFAMAFRLNNVKRAETRARKIEQFVEMLVRGETIYPQKRTRPSA